MPNVVKKPIIPNAIMLNVVMLNVVIMNAVMLNVVAPKFRSHMQLHSIQEPLTVKHFTVVINEHWLWPYSSTLV